MMRPYMPSQSKRENKSENKNKNKRENKREKRGNWVAAFALLFLVLCRPGSAAADVTKIVELERICASGTASELKRALKEVSADFVFPSGNRPLHIVAEHSSDPAVVELLVKHGASLSAEGLEGLTPLMLAAAYNPRVAVTKILLEAGASVNSADRQGRTPLYLASASGESPEVVSFLLKHGAQPNVRDKNGRTPLWVAAMRADAEIVSLLLNAGAKVDDPNNEGVTPLLRASEKPNAAVLRSLVEAGADVNVRGKDRYSSLMRAAAAGADAGSIRVLLDGKADVNAEDDQNRSAILLLTSRQDADPEALTVLIEAGANPNAIDASLMTPLMEACKQKNAAAVDVLLKAGAEVGLRDRNSWTALMHAASKGASEEVYALLKGSGADINESARQGASALMIAIEAKVKADGLRSLLRQGANPNHQTHDTISVLMSAVANADTDAVKLLLESGADPDQSTWDGLSPLMLAAQRTRDIKIFEIFAAAGANLNQAGVQGATALMIAVTEHNLPAVEKLVALGANLNAKDEEGFTPLIHAVQSGEESRDNLAIIDLLLAGCDVNMADAGRATPLMHAALQGKLKTAERLLGAGARIDAADKVGWTALHFAARSPSGLGVLRLLLEKQNPNIPDIPDNGGTTPLMIAASYNNEESTRFLLSAGASPARADNTGRNAYEYATLKNASHTQKAIEDFRE